MRGPVRLASALILLSLAAAPANGQSGVAFRPDDEMLAVFSGDNWDRLCERGAVRPVALLGELARAYGVNFFALPDNPLLRDRPIPDTIEARAAAWIMEADAGARHPGIDDAEYRKLNKMRGALAGYLQWASSAHTGHRYLALLSPADSALRPALFTPGIEEDASRTQALLLSLFGPVLGIHPEAPLTLSCLPPPPSPGAQVATQTPPVRGQGAHRSRIPPIAVRGQIDDLAALRGTDEFKKASFATVAFTDNNEAGTTNFAINGVVGLGTNFGPNNALYGFIQYTLNDQETDAPGDDDDSKDVHSISPGIFLRRPIAFGHSVYGTLGLTAYATFDLHNDAQLVRGRLLYSDIALALPPGYGSLCGQQRRLLFLYGDCRLSAFLEVARILDAGRNPDLQSTADDEYVGLGGQGGLILSPRGPAWLRPLNFTLNYRLMHILSGALDDPERLELSLAYALPLGPPAGGPGVTLGITRTLGENFETFQHEDLWKLTLGFKF